LLQLYFFLALKFVFPVFLTLQLSQSTFEKRPNYDAIQGANVTPATFYNIGDFEIQDNLARIWYEDHFIT
jgi:hypothetical protein